MTETTAEQPAIPDVAAPGPRRGRVALAVAVSALVLAVGAMVTAGVSASALAHADKRAAGTESSNTRLRSELAKTHAELAKVQAIEGSLVKNVAALLATRPNLGRLGICVDYQTETDFNDNQFSYIDNVGQLSSSQGGVTSCSFGSFVAVTPYAPPVGNGGG